MDEVESVVEPCTHLRRQISKQLSKSSAQSIAPLRISAQGSSLVLQMHPVEVSSAQPLLHCQTSSSSTLVLLLSRGSMRSIRQPAQVSLRCVRARHHRCGSAHRGTPHAGAQAQRDNAE